MKLRERIIEAHTEYKIKHGVEPDAVICEIKFKDDGSEIETIIKLNCESDERTDESIFFYCDHIQELFLLMDEDNNEDFYITEVYEFINTKEYFTR